MEVSSSLHLPSSISRLAKSLLTVAGVQLPASDRAGQRVGFGFSETQE